MIRTLFFGLLLALGAHVVVKTASRMPPERVRSVGRRMIGLLSLVAPRFSVLLNEAWAMGKGFHQAQKETTRAGMSPAEARRLLGVDERAGREEINAAYRDLMRSHHPDQGGSADMASRINAARDLLLAQPGV